MIRKALLAIGALLWGCAEPLPPPHADGSVVMSAVEHAQAQVKERGAGGPAGEAESHK